jgi:hypothetical protein
MSSIKADDKTASASCTDGPKKQDQVVRYEAPKIPEGWDTITKPVKGTLWSMRTYSYHPVDEVSSALQKAIRRGQTTEAIQWALEMFWTGSVAVTNLWNRMLVMVFEDIGPANLLVFWPVYYFSLRGKDDANAVVEAATLLAQSKKCRINDWACHVVRDLRDQQTVDTLTEGKLEYCQDKLFNSLKTYDSTNSIYWATALFLTKCQLTGRTKDAKSLIWKVFDLLFAKSEAYLRIRELAMTSTWRWKDKSMLPIMHLIVVYCRYRTLTGSNEGKFGAVKIGDHSKEIELFKQRDPKVMVGIPDYALDKHTKRGKSMGRDLQHFFDIGSHLENRCEEWAALDDGFKQCVVEGSKKL